MDRISVAEAGRNLEDLLNVVANGKQRFVLGDQGGDQAAFLSTEDLSLLETMDQSNKTAARPSVKIEFADLRKKFGARIARSASGERVVIVRDGQEVAALVPIDDIRTLIGLDGEIDLAVAKQLLDKQLRRQD